MVMMSNPKDGKKVGRPKSRVTLAVEKAYAEYEGKDAPYDVPRIVHQKHRNISVQQARKVYWRYFRQPKKKKRRGKNR